MSCVYCGKDLNTSAATEHRVFCSEECWTKYMEQQQRMKQSMFEFMQEMRGED